MRLLGAFLWAGAQVALPARADVMDLALSRLSVGDCAGTLAAPAALGGAGAPALVPDTAAFRQLVSQIASVVAASASGPVIGAGPAGFELMLETNVVDIDAHADALRRGTRGRGDLTCAGRSDDVRSVLVTQRLRIEKGLPYGFTVGANVGHVYATGSYLVGMSVKIALLEDAWRAWLPDLALRSTLTTLVGEPALGLHVLTADVLLSDRWVLARALRVAPFIGVGAMWTRARTQAVDLTPNIDALACETGRASVCTPPSTGDRAHDVHFEPLSLLRARGLAGLSLGYRFASLVSAATVDLARPRVGELGRGATQRRQWTVSVAPTLWF